MCFNHFFGVETNNDGMLQKTAIESHQQGACSGRYLGLPVIPTRLEPGPIEPNHISYPQYLNSTRSQISYLKEVHDLLLNASQNVGPLE